MAKQTIGIGASANDGTGDTLRTAGGKINGNFTELYNASDALYAVPAFITPTLTNSWAAFIDFDNTAPQYRKTANGWVEISGAAQSGTAGQPMFTLPGGYRPPKRMVFNMRTGTGTAQVDIGPDGEVICFTDLSGTFVALAGIVFLAA